MSQRKFMPPRPDGLIAVLLRAAYACPPRFTKQDLAVAAFRLDPARFALRGYSHLPDSNRVYAKLFGEVGLVARGYVARLDDATYELTDAGRRAASAQM